MIIKLTFVLKQNNSQIYFVVFQESRELEHFTPSSELLEVDQECLDLYPERVRMKIVASSTSMEAMIDDLSKQTEIAVDLEGHGAYSLRGKF